MDVWALEVDRPAHMKQEKSNLERHAVHTHMRACTNINVREKKKGNADSMLTMRVNRARFCNTYRMESHTQRPSASDKKATQKIAKESLLKERTLSRITSCHTRSL